MYCLATKKLKPINVIHDGAGPHIQTLKRICETYSTPEEAHARLEYLQENGVTGSHALTVRRLSECGIVIPEG